MPSGKHKNLKMTTTGTFRIENPDEPNTNTRPANIKLNRDVLERMLPQFAGRQLDSWICPQVARNTQLMSSSNHSIETL